MFHPLQLPWIRISQVVTCYCHDISLSQITQILNNIWHHTPPYRQVVDNDAPVLMATLSQQISFHLSSWLYLAINVCCLCTRWLSCDIDRCCLLFLSHSRYDTRWWGEDNALRYGITFSMSFLCEYELFCFVWWYPLNIIVLEGLVDITFF